MSLTIHGIPLKFFILHRLYMALGMQIAHVLVGNIPSYQQSSLSTDSGSLTNVPSFLANLTTHPTPMGKQTLKSNNLDDKLLQFQNILRLIDDDRCGQIDHFILPQLVHVCAGQGKN